MLDGEHGKQLMVRCVYEFSYLKVSRIYLVIYRDSDGLYRR